MEKEKEFKLLHIFNNIRFRERMLLIYIIGGIIPFIVATFWLNQRSREIILEQNKKAQSEEISLLCGSIRESMNVAEDVAAQIYNDATVKEIVEEVANKDYKSAVEFNNDCAGLDFIDKYTEYYKDEISDITIYVTNDSISSNQYFSFIGSEDMKKLRWYVPTCERRGKNYWAYAMDEVEKKKVPQLTKTIQNDTGEIIGVLAIQLSTLKTTERVLKRDVNSVLFYKENDIIAANFVPDKNYRAVFKNLWDFEGKKGSETVMQEVKEYLVTYERIYSEDSGIYFMVTSIQNTRDLMFDFTENSFISIITVVVGLIISIILIVIFSEVFGNRIFKLRKQMHHVANGEYDKVEPIEGEDEVGLLYRELEHMMKDIKKLTSKVVEEQVQKEKMHTQQKEVEFKMLASQINPHFLYNTLETIRMKAKINKQPEIEELVKMLAKIMRRNISVGDQMVTLQSEIELIENYLVIQNYRFSDRIRAEVVVDENVDTQIMVIPLIMQPFVENAYVHGLESRDSDGLLQIHVMQTEKDIIIEIRDNGAGMSSYKQAVIRRSLHEAKPFEKGHIGVNNVNQRIRILYGEEYGVDLHSVLDEGTCITIRFPAEVLG